MKYPWTGLTSLINFWWERSVHFFAAYTKYAVNCRRASIGVCKVNEVQSVSASYQIPLHPYCSLSWSARCCFICSRHLQSWAAETSVCLLCNVLANIILQAAATDARILVNTFVEYTHYVLWLLHFIYDFNLVIIFFSQILSVAPTASRDHHIFEVKWEPKDNFLLTNFVKHCPFTTTNNHDDKFPITRCVLKSTTYLFLETAINCTIQSTLGIFSVFLTIFFQPVRVRCTSPQRVQVVTFAHIIHLLQAVFADSLLTALTMPHGL